MCALSYTLHHSATHCSTLQLTATLCNTLHHTAAHCNTLQHTATHCNTLQHTAAHCHTLQHTATHCNTLQHTHAVIDSWSNLCLVVKKAFRFLSIIFIRKECIQICTQYISNHLHLHIHMLDCMPGNASARKLPAHSSSMPAGTARYSPIQALTPK